MIGTDLKVCVPLLYRQRKFGISSSIVLNRCRQHAESAEERHLQVMLVEMSKMLDVGGLSGQVSKVCMLY